MDGDPFDDRIRRLTVIRLTRGATLRGVIAGAAAAWTGATLTDDTEAKRKHRKHKRKHQGKGQQPSPQPPPPAPGLTPMDDVQGAIDQAAPGATIVLLPGTWALTRTLVIAKDLTLAGAGTGQSILDGGKAVRVLQIAPATTVTVQDLTITQGHAAEGGGIFNAGSLTLQRLSLANNRAGAGGALFNVGTATLGPGTTVEGNTAESPFSGQQGAIRATAVSDGAGGGVVNSGALAALLLAAGGAVAAAIIAANSAESGGGIHNDGGAVTLDAGSKVTQNTASEGAGIFNDGGTVTGKAGSSVTENTASTAGGGIYDTTATNGVSLASANLVTYNTPTNCFSLTPIPYCY